MNDAKRRELYTEVSVASEARKKYCGNFFFTALNICIVLPTTKLIYYADQLESPTDYLLYYYSLSIAPTTLFT